jgi:hypothetical protein
MKTNLKLLVTFTTFLIVTFSSEAQRQYAKRNTSFMIGIETTLAAQSLKFSTDIAAVKPINSMHVGPAFGIVAGTNVLSGRLSHSNLKSCDFGAVPTNVKQLDLSVMFNPMQLRSKGQKYFDVYLTAGTYRGSVELSGTYIPMPEKEEEVLIGEFPAGCPCCLEHHPTGPDTPLQTAAVLADPDAPSESGEQAFSEKLVTNYVNVGAGLQVRLHKKQGFANLFAEVKYGVPISTTSNGEALANTQSINQMSVSFGIRLGLSN